MQVSKIAITRLNSGYVVSDDTPMDEGELESSPVHAFGDSPEERAKAIACVARLLEEDEARYERQCAADAASLKTGMVLEMIPPARMRRGPVEVPPAGPETMGDPA